MFAVESAGSLDIDCELDLWVLGETPIKFNFAKVR